MARRTTNKPKEPVRVRTRKIANGNETVYLDIYVNGVRKYEYLRMYLIPERTAADKIRNANTLQAANAIKSQRILEITNGKAGIIDHTAAQKIDIGSFLRAYITKKRNSGRVQSARKLTSLLSYLDRWDMLDTKLGNIDKAFCLKLINQLRKSDLKQSTKQQYQIMFGAMLNDAVRNDILSVNPLTKIEADEKIKPGQSTREFLTVEEVQMLIDTPIARNENIKRAFLFSCFCGLRFSDIKALRWQDIIENQGKQFIRISMQKTKQEIIIPLSENALKWLPERHAQNDDECVFSRLGEYTNKGLQLWAAQAGIKKHVSYHVARHTFATMLITFGADLYTVSKLLGHTDIKVTQIYAKLVDAKKVEAVELFNGKFK